MEFLRWLFDAQFHVGNQSLLVREVLGNAFGLASALGGMRRKVWAWPVGIIGNLLLFTVFMGAFFGSPNPVNMLGQAGRQLMFITVSVWGWYRWRQTRVTGGAHAQGTAVIPQWASGWERAGLIAVMAAGTVGLTPVFRAMGSYEPVWSDAWIFTGSLLATYGMARGWVDLGGCRPSGCAAVVGRRVLRHLAHVRVLWVFHPCRVFCVVAYPQPGNTAYPCANAVPGYYGQGGGE